MTHAEETAAQQGPPSTGPAAQQGPAPAFARYLGSMVVVDTASSYVYLGRLAEVTSQEVVLADADVHDLTDSASSRDIYVLETRRHGVRENRREVSIRIDTVLSMSRLDDIIKY